VNLPEIGDGGRDDDRFVIDVMTDAMGGGEDEASVVAGLEALSRVGLGEVWTYLRTPGELSEGQRWRLRAALGLARAGDQHVGQARPLKGSAKGRLHVLAIDEFAAPLDRVTAMVVARALRRAMSARGDLCAVVATSHDDLVGALAPEVVVRCDFGAFDVRKGGSGHVAQ
jgi:ABC-type ATPase with predicted acetyltransferase domain